MTALVNKKTVGGPFPNASELIRVRYDFANDAGAQGAYDVLVADGALIVKDFYAVVKTTCTGTGATVKVGPTGDDSRFVTTTAGAVANLTANAVLRAVPVVAISLSEGTPNTETHTVTPRVPWRLADGEKVLMTIGTADLTAGAIEFVMEVQRVPN